MACFFFSTSHNSFVSCCTSEKWQWQHVGKLFHRDIIPELLSELEAVSKGATESGLTLRGVTRVLWAGPQILQ